MHEEQMIISGASLTAEHINSIKNTYGARLICFGNYKPIQRKEHPYDVVDNLLIKYLGVQLSEKDTSPISTATLHIRKPRRKEERIVIEELGTGHSPGFRTYEVTLASPNKQRLEQYKKGIEQILQQ